MSMFSRNVPLLATSQALMMSSMSLILTAAALVGLELAPDKAFATLPIAVIFISIMCTSIPAAMLMDRIGRKRGFMFATLFGMGGGTLATYAITTHNFWLFTLSSVFIGMFNSFGNYFRFTAADAVQPDMKSRAISVVMLGGVVAAIVGPNLANQTRNLMSETFAASYLSIVVLYILSLITLSFLKLPAQANYSHGEKTDKGRSISVIARQPKFIVALVCAMLGYGVMSFVMTATPLAMNHDAHTFADTSFVIQWHVLGMFAPSFVTGHLIQRFGVIRIMFTGALLGIACVIINLLGTSVSHFWLALTLLGISWNFLFIGGTTLLTETYKPEERARTQATNDFVIFTTVTIASLTAGSLQHHFGWQMINIGVLPLLAIILMSIAWLAVRQRRANILEEALQESS